MVYTRVLINVSLIITLVVIAYSALDPKWVLVVVSASIAYGVLGPVIATRRLYFLAGASAHSALLAVSLAIPLTYVTIVSSVYFWSIVIGMVLLYVIGIAIVRSRDPDKVTAVFVAMTASLSVMAIYYVLTNYPLSTSLWAYIIGDPLLADWHDVLISIAASAIICILIILTYREQVLLGIDRDSAKLAGIRVYIYDWALFTSLGLATIVMLRTIGFILEHIFILIPAAIATVIGETSLDALLGSLSITLISGVLGLYLAVVLNLAPAGMIGTVMLISYALILTLRKIFRR